MNRFHGEVIEIKKKLTDTSILCLGYGELS